MQDVQTLVTKLIELQRAYADTPRAIVRNVVQAALVGGLELDNLALREPLIEHVGHTPIVATFLHPHITHTKEVDLGRSLIMLAIHDIGETELGDIFAYKKTAQDEAEERVAALRVLHPSLHAYFEEAEAMETVDAKFAKSVDSLAPLLHEIDLPEVTMARFKHFGFNLEKIKQKKRPHFEWDEACLAVFDECMRRYEEFTK
jgi:5'-deoxynucleotidase YfbR-like HD superfamily hydrolase